MIQKVKIKSLNLSEFRNYSSLRLVFDSQKTILVGDNGAGKTNILEAISFLSPGRGLRRVSYTDVTRIGSASSFSAFARVEGMEGLADISMKLELKDNRAVRYLRINDVALRLIDELNDHLRINWLVPSMDRIFSGPSIERRRFLDRMVFSLDQKHRRRMIGFERLMRSRNCLLSEDFFDSSWCSSIESQMAELGIAIAVARQEMTNQLSLLIKEDTQREGFPSVELNVSGFMDGKLNHAFLALKQEYADILLERRKIDAIAGRALVGPHRSDLIVNYCDKDIKASHASTGEQKVVLVGIFLAHARLISTMTGFAPILLLDEVAAHLDEGRRNALFRIIDDIGGQTFMTGTDSSVFSSLGETARFIHVSHNQACYI